MKKLVLLALVVVILTGCSTSADVASQNISRAADQFEIQRRVVFYNGITGEYMFVVEGLCSLGNNDTAQRMSVTCKVGEDEHGKGIFVKNYLGLSDNVTFFAEQLLGVPADVYHYRVIFKPTTIVPDIDLSVP